MNLLMIWSDSITEYNCSWWRVHVPYGALKRAGKSVQTIHIDKFLTPDAETLKKIEWADLIFFQRNAFGPLLDVLQYWRGRGKVIVVDLDDGYEQMTGDTGSPSYKFWKLGFVTDQASGKEVKVDPLPIDALRYGVKISGALCSPSKVICDDWKDYVPTYWIPNFIHGKIYHKFEVSKEVGKIYIGWGGSSTHLKSFRDSGAADAIRKIVSEFKQVQILIAGDERVLSTLKLPAARVAKLGWMNLAMWPRGLSYFDIGIAPLCGDYDRRRSFIKGLEYMLMGIPWIATNYEPYQDLSGYGTLVENTETDWYKALKDHVVNFVDHKRRALENIGKGMEWDADENAEKLWALYENIYAERKP